MPRFTKVEARPGIRPERIFVMGERAPHRALAWIEYRPRCQCWDVMVPARYGWQEFPRCHARTDDLFAAIGEALKRYS